MSDERKRDGIAKAYTDAKDRIDPWDYAAMRQAMSMLADVLRDAEARAMYLEFRCSVQNGRQNCIDPRHDYLWPDWQQAADKKLRGEG